MIGKKFSVTEQKVIHSLKIMGEHLAYGKRFYDVEDSREPGITRPRLADIFDAIFKTAPGQITTRKAFNGRYHEHKPYR